MIDLTIPGAPTGKGRPRFTKQGRTFTDANTRRAEDRVYSAWMQAGQPRLPDGPVHATVEMALARPNGHYKRDGMLSAAGLRSEYPTKKPDCDNVAKLVCDSLNGCAYRDDAHVVRLLVIKRWANPGEDEHTRVWLDALSVPGVQAVAA